MIDDGTCYRCRLIKYHEGPCEEETMSEPVLPFREVEHDKARKGNHFVARNYWMNPVGSPGCICRLVSSLDYQENNALRERVATLEGAAAKAVAWSDCQGECTSTETCPQRQLRDILTPEIMEKAMRELQGKLAALAGGGGQ